MGQQENFRPSVLEVLRPEETHLFAGFPKQKSCLSLCCSLRQCRCPKDALGLLGWGYDILCELLACADVATNVLVAMQLLRSGHAAWGWTVLGFTVNASIVYASMLMQAMPYVLRNVQLGKWLKTRRKATLFFVFLPFAHVLMAVFWFLTTFVYPESYNDALPVDLSEVATTRAAKEEAAAVERCARVMGRIAQGLKTRDTTHIFLLAEALAEALPQAIVQLLALSLMGSATTLQIVSVCISLMALLTKSTCLCLSCDLRVFAFKLLVIAHDTFSLLYVVTTLLSRDDPHRTEEFVRGSGILVSPLGFAWLAKEAAVATLAVIYGLALAGVFLGAHFHVPGMHISARNFRYAFIFFVSVFGFLPGLALLEGFKLSLVVLLVWTVEPRFRAATHVVALFAFCNHGNDATCSSSEVWRSKMKHLYFETARSQTHLNESWRYNTDYSVITEKIMGMRPIRANTDISGHAMASLDSAVRGD